MSYRGIYLGHGMVHLEGDVELAEGARVDVNPTSSKSVKGGRKSARRGSKSARTKSTKHPLPGFGAWKHRDDIVDSAEFARELGRRTTTRPRR